MTRRWLQCLAAVALLVCCGTEAWSAVERVVILKVDGLPFDTLDYYVRRKDPRTGKSVLPWIDHLFYERGTQFRNFYNRGLSLSASSWALLDSGQPSVIKGNLEFDRLTLRSYDYLNMFTHILRNSTGSQTATPAAQVMDEQGIRLLSDAYGPAEKYVSLQLLSRGLMANPKSASRLFSLQSPKGWLDEWTIGLQGDQLFVDTLEKDLIAKLKDPQVRYLDFLLPVFDHTAHVNREPEAIQRALQEVDAAVGEVWAAIEKSSFADKTVLVVISDHGMNTDPAVYSQGYNLIDLFASAKRGRAPCRNESAPAG
jgi:type I phosphodiesterase/nucleotide pyrophosphatase